MIKSLLAIFIFQLCLFNVHAQIRTFYVSPNSNNVHPIGTLAMPFKTIESALSHISTEKEKQIVILLRRGTYYLDTTLVLSNSFLQNHALTIASYKNEKVNISGTRRLTLEWKTYRNNILQSYVGKGLQIDHLYYNGKALPMARYPNYDENARVFNGTAEDATSKERVKKWSNPVGGYVHALHIGEWGSFHYLITGVNANGELQLTGGWQMNRPAPMHKSFRFVENIFEELDVPGEWYYNKQEGILYFYPFKNRNTLSARFEYSVLNDLIAIKGSAENPVKNITINGIRFTGTNRTFMLTKEPIARSDWAVYRGGAILLDGTKHINITNCHFEALGGNAIFVSNYNRNDTISGNEINDIGSSAILFMGSQEARRPAFKYDQIVPINKMDMEPGPKTNNYPAQCIAYNNLIHDIGRIEKQVAGVGIDMASEITVSHNTIYRVPRAGINIGDGCWGGHLIEFNDVFYTVQETGDHGAFNSWGRDRYWISQIATVDSIVILYPSLPFLDAVETNVIKNNRFHCTRGWDIDLDDGSSNYLIYNNLCLNGGLKLREGYERVVENNIIINNSLHPHVWYEKGNDIFKHNIVGADYAPIGIKVWGKEIDSNFFVLKSSLLAAQQNHTDKNSLCGNPIFFNSAVDDFTVRRTSDALKIGFKNFPMKEFGVVSNFLKSKALKAPTPDTKIFIPIKGKIVKWLGAELKNTTLDERSAAGLFDENGVYVLKVSDGSLAQKSGLRERDVIRKINNKPVNNIAEFLAATQINTWQGEVQGTVIRNQSEQKITFILK